MLSVLPNVAQHRLASRLPRQEDDNASPSLRLPFLLSLPQRLVRRSTSLPFPTVFCSSHSFLVNFSLPSLLFICFPLLLWLPIFLFSPWLIVFHWWQEEEDVLGRVKESVRYPILDTPPFPVHPLSAFSFSVLPFKSLPYFFLFFIPSPAPVIVTKRLQSTMWSLPNETSDLLKWPTTCSFSVD